MARRICITPGCEFYAEPNSEGCVYCLRGEIPETEARQRLREQNRESPAETADREQKQREERKELARQEQMSYAQSQAQANQPRKAIVSNLHIGQYVCDKSANKIGKICRIRLDSKITVDLTYEDTPTEETSPLKRTMRSCHTTDHVDVLNLVVDLTDAQLTWIKEHNEKITRWETSQKAKFLSLLGTLEIGQTKDLLNEKVYKLQVQRKSPAQISHQVANKTGYWKDQAPYSVTLYGSQCPMCNSEMTKTHTDNGGDLGRAELDDIMVCTTQNCGFVRRFQYDGPDTGEW